MNEHEIPRLTPSSSQSVLDELWGLREKGFTLNVEFFGDQESLKKVLRKDFRDFYQAVRELVEETLLPRWQGKLDEIEAEHARLVQIGEHRYWGSDAAYYESVCVEFSNLRDRVEHLTKALRSAEINLTHANDASTSGLEHRLTSIVEQAHLNSNFEAENPVIYELWFDVLSPEDFLAASGSGRKLDLEFLEEFAAHRWTPTSDRSGRDYIYCVACEQRS